MDARRWALFGLTYASYAGIEGLLRGSAVLNYGQTIRGCLAEMVESLAEMVLMAERAVRR